MFIYKLFDGFNWYEMAEEDDRMDMAVLEDMAQREVDGWDYDDIAHRVDIYEVEVDYSGDELSDDQVGFVVSDGREYTCPVCHSSFPHPASELAVCHCGNVVAEPDPAEEDEEEDDE